MFDMYIESKKKYLKHRIFIDIIGIMSIICISILNINLFEHVYLFLMLNSISIGIASLIILFYILPIFRDKDSIKKYTINEKFSVIGISIIGTIILFSNIVGFILIPFNTNQLFEYESGRIITSLLVIIYTLCLDLILNTILTDVRLRIRDIKRNHDPKDSFSISTSIDTDKKINNTVRAEKTMNIISFYCELLFFIEISFFIISIINMH